MWTSQVYGHHDKMARTKTHRTSQNTEYTTTQQTLRNNYFCVVCFLLLFFNFQLLKGLLQKMLKYRLGTVNEKHWGFKPVFRCSKLFQHYILINICRRYSLLINIRKDLTDSKSRVFLELFRHLCSFNNE